MAGRLIGRPSRRHETPSSSLSSSTSISTARLFMVSLGLCYLMYVISTHSILFKEMKGRAHVDARSPAGPKRAGTEVEGNIYANEDPRDIRNADEPTNVALICDGKRPPIDMSYWKDIPKDKRYVSPWGESARRALANGDRQYVTFEPDHGGFNNIRMQMETVMVFAKATGRTLVMPPAQKFYLLKKPASEFADMFPVEGFAEYMDVIPMEVFLEKEGITGKLGKFPPHDRTSGHTKEKLDEYLREVADFVPCWDHMTQALVFGPSPNQPDIPNDGKAQLWLEEFLTSKRTRLSYTEEMQHARLIHFRTSSAKKRGADVITPEYRLFTHFYTFIGFSDPVAAQHHKRLVRDAVHFRESLFCVSSRIVDRLRTVGRGDSGRWSGWHGEGGGIRGSGDGNVDLVAESSEGIKRAGFSSLHVRRGDFQYTRMKPPASVIVEATKDIRIRGEVLYIATDERDKSFFEDFSREHRLFFLDDFEDLLKDVDPSYYLMLDTIVASQGRFPRCFCDAERAHGTDAVLALPACCQPWFQCSRAFIGTWRSTFTGYITRLRGYYNYPAEFSLYYWTESKNTYEAVSLAADSVPRSPFYMREWPSGWEDIDEPV